MTTSLPQDFSHILCQDRHALRSLAYKIRQRERRGLPAEQMREKYLKQYQTSNATYQQRLAQLPKPALSADLPVLAKQAEIRHLIEHHQVVIISGETGSGKTTQLPQICLDLGLGAAGMIAHTQPRRIAARSVADRIAEELGVALGSSVGYQVRFDEQISEQTAVKLMTDGMLLAETLSDKFLSQYEVIIVDEAHERSLNIDFLLGYLRQLLPKRPDLKVIITSATIDTEKFAAHFNNAPIINVSGRSYPVEIRYRDPLPDSDMQDNILQAVEELDHESRGDILIFFPTERDIREAADSLRKANLRDTEIQPLFGRLSLAEQNAVFHPKGKRRIVLATNVAETSLTVPRIKYVIDTGTARISRYSLRSKTQRLPIEAISQAAANQRAGRCGRLSAGICIRLYSEEDFKQRPAFTEPEILRTNLAAVILQMLVLHLGDIAAFPFVDSPDQRQINDGYRLLFELRAVDEDKRLTALGKKMAHLPVDPRFARIVYAAEDNACLHEALIIIAALSIQDPRERPFGAEAQADMRQGEFADKHSDFQTLLNLFVAYSNARREHSNNKLRAWCKHYFLNAQRMREWRELTNQLMRDAHQQKLRINDFKPAPNRRQQDNLVEGSKGNLGFDNPHLPLLHRSLLAGFLDQVGLWDEQNKDYTGPRHRKFSIFPASVLAKQRPQAIMAASIVEINRVFARHCAPIELHELENLAAHITKRQYSNPHWSKKAGNVMAEESLLLYGLPIVAGRKKPFAKQNPALAHDIFVQEALVTGEIHSRLSVIAENIALWQELQTLEDKTRSRGILIDEQALADFYFQRLPEKVHSVVSLEQWAKQKGEAALKMQASDLLQNEADISAQEYPEHINIRGQRFQLQYQFDPGSEADGVTVLVPLTALNALEAEDFERLVPAMLEEKIEALLRRLPKVWRRQLVPIPDFARALHERLQDSAAPLAQALSDGIWQMKGLRIPLEDFDESKLEAHYRMNFRLLDPRKRPLAEGRDLAALKVRYQAQAAAQFQERSRSKLADGQPVQDWQWTQLPDSEKMAGGIIGYPALTLEKGQLFLRLHDNPEQAARAHHEGLRHLLAQKLASQGKYLKKNLPQLNTMSLHYRKISHDNLLADDIFMALIERVCLSEGKALRSQSQFDAALAQGEKHLISAGNELAAQLSQLLSEYSRLNERLRQCKHKSAKADISAQIARLVFPDFIRQTAAAKLPDLLRYIKAANLRLDKLEREPLKDAMRQSALNPWQALLDKSLSQQGISKPSDSQNAALLAYAYALEEYRIQTFAQEIGSKSKISEKILADLAEKLPHGKE